MNSVNVFLSTSSVRDFLSGVIGTTPMRRPRVSRPNASSSLRSTRPKVMKSSALGSWQPAQGLTLRLFPASGL
jgi:hypothetical protein